MFPQELLPLLEKVQTYNKQADFEQLHQAYLFAARAHAGQLRASGEQYITHPLGVALILADNQLDTDTLAAALLHDVVEDSDIPLQEIEAKFGSTVSLLVDGVTKLGRLEDLNKQEQQAENLRKMFLAMAEDLRVILIKLADRLHNMRTLRYKAPPKQRETAKETLEIFAPLANRLGLSRIQWELEDLSFRHMEPEKYKEISELIARKRVERESIISHAILDLQDRLQEIAITADISGRPKHFFSIYRKMQAGRSFDEIYDLTAIRVIVNSIKDCYEVLGTIHSLWKPIPGRFKDYIAMPKPNMYQSLHTTVVGELGEPLEIQIRTWEMHRIAEHGIAAHWMYKEGMRADQKMQERLSWLRSILEWQQELRDAEEFVDGVKLELYTDEVFVFTPKGDVINLPAGSTPLDFAYRIHTNLGHRCVGAKINGRIVTLPTPLKNGDIVEILTSNKISGPSPDWLKIVRTSGAKSKIRAWFKKEQREENITKGIDLLEREVRRLGFEPSDVLTDARLQEISVRQNFLSAEDLFAALGYGGISLVSTAGKLVELYRKENPTTPEPLNIPESDVPRRDSLGVRVHGLEDALIRFSRCCHPLPGDPIIGYITRGRGVSIHTVSCSNAQGLQKEPERLIDVYWDDGTRSDYPVRIEISALDRTGLLHEIVKTLADNKVNINSMQSRTERDRIAVVTVTIVVRDLPHLEQIKQRLAGIRDVFTVQRVAAQATTKN